MSEKQLIGYGGVTDGYQQWYKNFTGGWGAVFPAGSVVKVFNSFDKECWEIYDLDPIGSQTHIPKQFIELIPPHRVIDEVVIWFDKLRKQEFE